MRKSSRKTDKSIAVALVAVCFAAAAAADTLHLHNGDRLTGEFKTLSEGAVVFATAYAGEVTVPLEHIRAVITEKPVAACLTDGSRAAGFLVDTEHGQGIVTEAGAQPLPLDTVASAGPVPPEPEPEPADDAKKWGGEVTAGATYYSNDTETLDVTLGAKVVRTGKRSTLTLGAAGSYGEVDSERHTRRGRLSAKWQYYLEKRLYVFGEGAVEHEMSRRLDARLDTGAGLGYDFVKRERTKLAADLGVGYTHEWWRTYTQQEFDKARDAARLSAFNTLQSTLVAAITRPVWTFGDIVDLAETINRLHTMQPVQETYTETRYNLRLSATFEQKLFADCLLSDKVSFVPNVDDPTQYRLNNTLAFDTPLTDRLGLRVSLETEYDTGDGAQGEEMSNTLTTSLRYAF